MTFLKSGNTLTYGGARKAELFRRQRELRASAVRTKAAMSPMRSRLMESSIAHV